MTLRLVFTRQAQKDAKKLAAKGPKPKAENLLAILADDPFRNPPPYEKRVGDLQGAYSRRINIQHRLVYDVFVSERTVRVLRLWTHYEYRPTCGGKPGASCGIPVQGTPWGCRRWDIGMLETPVPVSRDIE